MLMSNLFEISEVNNGSDPNCSFWKLRKHCFVNTTKEKTKGKNNKIST